MNIIKVEKCFDNEKNIACPCLSFSKKYCCAEGCHLDGPGAEKDMPDWCPLHKKSFNWSVPVTVKKA